MSYLTQSHANRPAAFAGVIGIHAGLGALVVLGLTITGNIPEVYSGPLPTRDYPDPPPPPPPPEPTTEQDQTVPSAVVTPPIAPLFPIPPIIIETTPTIPPFGDDVLLTAETSLPNLGADTGPAPFQPSQVSPRNDPSRWLTDADYRSSWIRKEMSGTASFTLIVGANGRVETCSISRSTGHTALDAATCKLISKRARFTPAMNTFGEPTTGSYSSSIRWIMPD